ncbi:MAG: MFS transporter [Elusimicrobia bacterium]|nr:MFS transporter [Elusimicrobiota bacterium]
MKSNLLSKNKNFFYLWLGQLISALGDRLMQMGILTLLMVVSRDDGSKMAFVTFFSVLPFLVLGPVFGVWIDRFSRKKIMIIADLVRSAIVILVPILWVNTHSAFLIVLLVFVMGSLGALFSPAKMSILANITRKEDLLEANSLIITTGTIATLVGTLFAGAIIKFTGPKTGFYVNSVTYFISAIFIMKIIYCKPVNNSLDTHSLKIVFSDLKEGLGYLKRHQLLKNLILLSSIVSFITSFVYILLLNYGTNILSQNSLGLGLLLSSAGLGMVLGSLILLRKKDRINYNFSLYATYFILGFSCFAFLSTPTFGLTLLILFCAGISLSILTIVLDTIYQRLSPDELKGKLIATRGMVTSTVFLISLLLIGILIKVIPVIILFGIIGSVSMVVGILIFLSARNWGYQIVRMILKILMKLFFNFKVTGRKNVPYAKKIIFAGNHTSLIDGVALMCAFPDKIYFLAADSLFKRKFLGWCAKQLGYLPVKRGGLNKDSIKESVKIMNEGYSIGIFPEGRITEDGRLVAGKAGVALIAKLTGAKIVPFALEGAFEAWPLGEKYPKRFPVELRFGEPIVPGENKELEALTAEIMKDIGQIKITLEREGYLQVDPNDLVRQILDIK